MGTRRGWKHFLRLHPGPEFSSATPRVPSLCLARSHQPWQKGLQAGPVIALSSPWSLPPPKARNLMEPHCLYWALQLSTWTAGLKVTLFSDLPPWSVSELTQLFPLPSLLPLSEMICTSHSTHTGPWGRRVGCLAPS